MSHKNSPRRTSFYPERNGAVSSRSGARRRAALRRHPLLAMALLVGVLLATGTTALAAVRSNAIDADRLCTVDARVHSWSTGKLRFEARSVRTGEIVAKHHARAGAETGSTMKVLTAAAALAALGPNHRFETRVVSGTEPGTVVLVGGGDPTLSRLPSGQGGVYPDAPHLDDLARQVRAALGTMEPRRVEVHTDLFTGPAWHPTWPEDARTSGSVSNITSLMVDGDRDDPDREYSLRSATAVARAADAFAALLGPDVTADVTSVPVPVGARTLASVRSAPVSELVGTMLTRSDDTLAEVLARHVAVAEGAGGSFDSIQAGTTAALRRYGVPVAHLRLVDGSGLSSEDEVSPDYLTRLMAKVAEKRHGLGPVFDGLPIAGETGTLAEHGRYRTANRDARGHIRAKTGTLSDMFGLTGVTDGANGDPVVFTIFAEGTSDVAAREDIDALAAELWRCGGAA